MYQYIGVKQNPLIDVNQKFTVLLDSTGEGLTVKHLRDRDWSRVHSKLDHVSSGSVIWLDESSLIRLNQTRPL